MKRSVKFSSVTGNVTPLTLEGTVIAVLVYGGGHAGNAVTKGQ